MMKTDRVFMLCGARSAPAVLRLSAARNETLGACRLAVFCACLFFGSLSVYAASSSAGSAQGSTDSADSPGNPALAKPATQQTVQAKAGEPAKSGEQPKAASQPKSLNQSADSNPSLAQNPTLSSATLSSSAKAILERAFTLKDRSKITQALESGAVKQSAPADKKGILAALASYEERIGAPESAARHYAAAATADPASRDDSLLLDAARASLAANDTEAAGGYVRTVLLTGLDDRLLSRSRVYAAWISLAKGDDPQSLSLIRTLAQGKAFVEYAPALLFTLWWASGDTASRDALIATYPATPEAAIASGSMSLAPAPFWYLMGRNSAAVASFALEGTKNLSKSQSSASNPKSPATSATNATGATTSSETHAGASSTTSGTSGVQTTAAQSTTAQTASAASDSLVGVWQQVGFFKSRENADELVARLQKLGFRPVVRSDKRPSGTVYFAVLVPEDKNRTVAGRLKDSGFESYLVADGQ